MSYNESIRKASPSPTKKRKGVLPGSLPGLQEFNSKESLDTYSKSESTRDMIQELAQKKKGSINKKSQDINIKIIETEEPKSITDSSDEDDSGKSVEIDSESYSMCSLD